MFGFEMADVMPFVVQADVIALAYAIVVDVVTITARWQMLLPYDVVVDVETT